MLISDENINLKDGTGIKISQYETPAPELSNTIIPFLIHKGPSWLSDIRNRLNGEYPESTDRFFLACVNEKPVSHLWLTTSKENRTIGLLGHIFTSEKHRGRGISSVLLEAAHSYFFNAGGKILILQTSNPVAWKYYSSRGYITLFGDTSKNETAMMYKEAKTGDFNKLIELEKDAYWVERRNLLTGDLAALEFLYCIADDKPITIKNGLHGVLSGYETEGIFGELFKQDAVTEKPVYLNKVEAGTNMLRSVLTVRKRTLSIERISDIDFFILPGFEKGFYELAEETFAELENFPQLILEHKGFDNEKFRILKDFGFKKVREEENYYLYRGEMINASVYRKKLP